jgi:hypothetical protein
VAASGAQPPFDGLHWKPIAKVFEAFRERWGILAADRFNAQPWWYRWSTASGWPRRLVHTVLPPETRIEIDRDSDALDPNHDDEIDVRLNGESCCGWLAVWDPPAAAESSSPPASSTQLEPAAPSRSPPPERAEHRHAGGRDPDHNWEGAARCVDQHVADHGPLRRHRTGERAGEPVRQHAVNLILGWFEARVRERERENRLRPTVPWVGRRTGTSAICRQNGPSRNGLRTIPSAAGIGGVKHNSISLDSPCYINAGGGVRTSSATLRHPSPARPCLRFSPKLRVENCHDTE